MYNYVYTVIILPDIIQIINILYAIIGIALKSIFFLYYPYIIYILYQNMCTYGQIKKWRPFVPKLYASGGKDISKCIEGGSIIFTTLT